MLSAPVADVPVARTAAVTAEARTVLSLNMLELLVEGRLLGCARRTGRVLRKNLRRHAHHALLTHAAHQPFALTSLPPMAPHEVDRAAGRRGRGFNAHGEPQRRIPRCSPRLAS